MNSPDTIQPAPFARIALKLLKGPVYMDQASDWQDVEIHLRALQRYLGQIGLELIYNPTEGYAFLSQQIGRAHD